MAIEEHEFRVGHYDNYVHRPKSNTHAGVKHGIMLGVYEDIECPEDDEDIFKRDNNLFNVNDMDLTLP